MEVVVDMGNEDNSNKYEMTTPLLTQPDQRNTSGHSHGHSHGHNHNHSHGHDKYDADKYKQSSSNFSQFFRILRADREAKRISAFALLMITMAVVELIVAFFSESVTVLSSGLHSFSDSAVLIISILAFVVSKKRVTPSYTYGFDRFEVLSVFASSTLMLFVSLYIVFESLERFLELSGFEYENVLLASIPSSIIHICGVIFFHEHINMRAESVLLPTNDTMKGISRAFLNVFPSISTFVVAWIVGTLSWNWVDPIVGIFNAYLLAYKAYPFALSTGRILLQSVPISIKHIIDQSLQDALTVEGVLEIYNAHFWTNSPGVYVGSLNVRVRSDANEQSVLRHIRSIYSPYIKYLTLQVEKWNVQ